MKERSFPITNGHLNVAVGPDHGPPLVLFHGVTRCWRDFAALLPDLTKRWQVWAVEHRGHGGSSRGGSAYRVADFAADAIAFLDAYLADRPPILIVGHSLGAMVAAVVGAERPQRMRALVLEDPPGATLGSRFQESRFLLQFTNTRQLLGFDNHGAGTPGATERLARALAEMRVQRPIDGVVVPFRELRDKDALRFSAECLRQVDPAVLDTLIAERWLEGLDWFGLLPRIECPVLLLRADLKRGGMLETAEAALIRALLPRCERVDLVGVGHSIHSSEPQRMLELIARFLENNPRLSKGSHK